MLRPRSGERSYVVFPRSGERSYVVPRSGERSALKSALQRAILTYFERNGAEEQSRVPIRPQHLG